MGLRFRCQALDDVLNQVRELVKKQSWFQHYNILREANKELFLDASTDEARVVGGVGSLLFVAFLLGSRVSQKFHFSSLLR